jgi:dipeptidyl-peptidase 4
VRNNRGASLRRRVLLAGVAIGLLLAPSSEPSPARAQAPGGRAPTLERLYSLPRLIGTAPKGFAWSADSTRLAFLWNDEGTNFYDVWVTRADTPKPSRVTRMPRPQPGPASTTDSEIVKRHVDAERDPGVQAVTWHPDGTRLLVTFRGNMYVVPAAGGEPQAFPAEPGNKSRAQFSPDGRSVAFVSGGDLFVAEGALPPTGVRRVTKVAADGVRIDRFAWSPDGSSIAFVEEDVRRVRRRVIPDYLPDETATTEVPRALPGEESASRRLGVVPLQSGEPRWMDLGPNRLDEIFTFSFAPDGRSLLVDKSDVYVKDRRLLIVDAAAGTSRELYREQNPNNVQAQWEAAWAPDGRGVYFLSDRDEDYHIYLLSLTGGTPTRITQGDWAVSDFTVSAPASAIFLVGNQGRPEERHIFRVGLNGGEVTRMSRQPGTHAPLISPDGRYAADSFSSDTIPYDLLMTRLHGATGAPADERQVTNSPLAEFSQYRWVQPEYVTFKNHVDGAILHGRLTLPPNLDRTRKYPVIIGSVYTNTVRNQWGGRTAHPTWGLDQYLAHQGYILLNVDIRGSSGHGKAFRQGIRLDYGGIDTEDLYSGVLYLKTLPFVDPARIGMWGSSYGGLLTCMSLFKKPGVYKAGVAGAPATNVFHATTGEMRVMMSPQDHPKEYASASAFTFAHGLQDHLMIIHGMRDTVVLFRDSVSLVERLMLLGKDVDFVVAPNSHHGWDAEGLYQTLFTFRKLVEHFERHLGKGPTPASDQAGKGGRE